jgi:amidase
MGALRESGSTLSLTIFLWILTCLNQGKLVFLDSGEEYRETLAEAGEPATPMLRWALEEMSPSQPIPLAETWKLNVQRDAIKLECLQRWNVANVDVVLSTVSPTLAARHDTSRWWNYSSYDGVTFAITERVECANCGSHRFWNICDLPAVTFPIGRYRASQGGSISGPSLSAKDDYFRALWEPKAYDGAPIALQLIGRRLQEEKLLSMLQTVEVALGQRN